MRLLTLTIVATFLALPAAAQVYQCKDVSGKLILSDSPCSSDQSGALIQRKKSDDESYRERAEAAEANERKQQRQMNEMQQRQIESQQRVIEQQARKANAPAPEQLGASSQCKEARKELEFVSSIRTLSLDEKRIRTNAAITSVNAACGSNTPLMQEPPKPVFTPRAAQPVPLSSCKGALCYDSNGGIYNRNGQFISDSQGRSCRILGGTMIECD